MCEYIYVVIALSNPPSIARCTAPLMCALCEAARFWRASVFRFMYILSCVFVLLVLFVCVCWRGVVCRDVYHVYTCIWYMCVYVYVCM